MNLTDWNIFLKTQNSILHEIKVTDLFQCVFS